MNKLKTKGCQTGGLFMYNVGVNQLWDLYAVS